MAGPAVANAWAATAAVPEGVTELFAVEQAVLAGSSVGAGGPRQRCQRPAQLLLPARPRQPKVRPPAAATDQVSDRLAYFFERAGAHRPVSCPEARQREWRTFLSQVAVRKVSAAEPATIDRVLRTIEELERWQFSRGRADGLSDCDSVDLSAFLTEGTTAPARALSALRWLAKHGRLGWDFPELVLGKRPGHQVSARGQAIPAEPFMPSLLEQKIVTYHQQGDARWAPLLGSWLVAFGCVRYKHVERSVVIRISRSSVHLWCARGKQAHKRQGGRYPPGRLRQLVSYSIATGKAGTSERRQSVLQPLVLRGLQAAEVVRRMDLLPGAAMVTGILSGPSHLESLGSDPGGKLSVRRSASLLKAVMSHSLVPRDGSNFAAALDTLALNFSLDPAVVTKLKAEGLPHLEELRFFFDNEDHVGRWEGPFGGSRFDAWG
eukprot:s3674_g4.t1